MIKFILQCKFTSKKFLSTKTSFVNNFDVNDLYQFTNYIKKKTPLIFIFNF